MSSAVLAEHEFAVTTAARRLARGEAMMQEVIDVIDVRDRIHTLVVYTLALLLAVFSRKRVQNMFDTPPGRPRRSAVGRTRTNLDTTTPGGRLVFHAFAALAEFIRELIVIGTNEGLAAARARGRVGGRELRAGAGPRQLEAPAK